MSYFLCKSLLFRRFGFSGRNPIAYNHLNLKWLSSSVKVSPNKLSFKVSYLINSLGYSLEASKAMSKCVGFKTRAKPDKAIDFLTNFGFSQTQISRLVRAFPKILVLNTEKSVLPILEFLESKGISRPQLIKKLSLYPGVLRCSLDNQIIPRFECLKVLLPSETKISRIIERYPDILRKDIEKYVSPNVSTLRSHRVPDSNIFFLFCKYALVFLQSHVWFRETVEEVAEMGFNPAKVSFIIAVCAKVNKSKWESKVCHYKKSGWSENDVSRAFLRYPGCMMASEDKITSVMDFFVREMGLKPIDLADYPAVFSYSLKKRIIPRVRVFQAVVSKGLLKERCNLYTLVVSMEKYFLHRYVTPYEDIAPELLEVYKDAKSDLSNEL